MSKRLSRMQTFQKPVMRRDDTLCTDTAYVFQCVLDELEKYYKQIKGNQLQLGAKSKSHMIPGEENSPRVTAKQKRDEEVQKRLRTNEQFLQRQIAKMYNEKTPDYLKDSQPGNAMVKCKDLIQQISDDHSTAGIPGELCMQQIIQKYKKILSKRFQSEQKREQSDTNKLIKQELQKMRVILGELDPE